MKTISITFIAILAFNLSVSAQNQPSRRADFPYSNRFTLGGATPLASTKTDQ